MRPFQYCVEICHISIVLEEDAVEEDERADEQHDRADLVAAASGRARKRLPARAGRPTGSPAAITNDAGTVANCGARTSSATDARRSTTQT